MKRCWWIVLGLLMPGVLAAKDPKLSAEEIIGRHLESIGPPALRASITSRIVEGQLELSGRLYKGVGEAGAVHLVTEKGKLRLSLPASAGYYQGEDMAFDGQTVRVWINGQSGSPVSDFFNRFTDIIKYGFLGGTLSTRWSLLDAREGRKLQSIGPTDFEGQKFLRLEHTYDGLRVRLYFDAQTFRHVRTSYAFPGFLCEERFGNFQVIDGFTLPTDWLVRYRMLGLQRLPPPNDYQDWQIVVLRMKHNEQVSSATFQLAGPVPRLQIRINGPVPNGVP